MANTNSYSGGILSQLVNNQKLFVGIIRNDFGTYVDGTVSLTAGTIVGRVRSSGKIKVCVSTNHDGSQIPIGILMNDYSVVAGTDKTVQFLTNGDVNLNMVNYNGSTDLTTVLLFSDTSDAATTTVAGTIRDILHGKYINLIDIKDSSIPDNA